MRAIGRILRSVVFWSYERGTVPYDAAVAVILVFVLLTPRGWFHDRPQLGPPDKDALVVLVQSDGSSGLQTYRVDARALALPIPTPELEHMLHDAIRNSVPELKGRPFQIRTITPIRAGAGGVVSYEVAIKP